jgi:hypothetical protein
MGILIKCTTLAGSLESKTGFYNASNIGDLFELGYSLYPTDPGIGSSWAISTEPYNSGAQLYAWGASVSIPETTEAVELNKSGTNTAAIIAASLDGTAAYIASIYTQNDYTGYVLPSYEGALKMEIGLVPFDPTIFVPTYDGVSFWTSTEKDATKAYYFTIRDGLPWVFGFAPKTDLKAVWPIIQYNYQAS